MKDLLTLTQLLLLGALLALSSFSWGSSNLQKTRSFVSTLDKLNNPPLSCTKREPDPEVRKWEEAGYGNPVINYLDNLYPPDDKKEYTHQFELDIVLARNNYWTKDMLQERYEKAAKVYAQCGVKIQRPRVITVDSPQSIEEFNPGSYDQKSSYRFGERIPSKNTKMTMIHVKFLTDGSTAVGGPLWFFEEENHPLLYKQWMSARITTKAYKDEEDPHYSPEAHEIGHVLLDCEHLNDSPNLMSSNFNENTGKYIANGNLTKDQCNTIKQHKLVTKIDPT